MTLLLPLLAVLIPILALPFWFFYFDITPKLATLLGLTSIACLLAARDARPLRTLWSLPRGRILALLLGAQAVIALAATAASPMAALSFSGGNWRRFGLVTQLALLTAAALIAAGLASKRLNVRYTLRAVAISGSLIAAYAVLQYFGWDPLLPSAAYHIGEGAWTIVRPPGTIGHADYLGCYLVFVVFLGGSLMAREQSAGWRLAGAFAAVAGSFAVLLSGTRSAILGVAVGAILLVVRRRPGLRRAAAAISLLAVGLGWFYYSPWGLKLRGRTRWYVEDPLGGARLLLWRDSLRMARDRPLRGWGPETFTTEFARFQSLELARAYPDFYHESPHNIFIDELVSKGVPAMLLLAGFCGWASIAAWKALRRRKDAGLGAAFLGGLVSLQFNSFVLTTAFFCYLTALMLIAFEFGEPGAETAPGGLRWRLLLGGVGLGVFFAWFGVRLCAADVLLACVKTRLEANDVMGAASLYESSRRWQPPGVNSDLYYSRNMSAIGRKQRNLMPAVKAFQEAVQAGIRSAQLGEEKQISYYHLASVYAQVNDSRDAERNLRSAIAYAPNWFKPRWMLARLLEAGGRHAEALNAAKEAVDREGGKHAEVRETLEQIRKRSGVR
ncbi:MAG: O-antigen ligase family protein [Bryobacterales bacterium]|nr:O-antigen ligase family protein [Bryobacterales bacterium]